MAFIVLQLWLSGATVPWLMTLVSLASSNLMDPNNGSYKHFWRHDIMKDSGNKSQEVGIGWCAIEPCRQWCGSSLASFSAMSVCDVAAKMSNFALNGIEF